MASNLTISKLLTAPTLQVNGRSGLSVGIQLSDGRRFWGSCLSVPAASRMSEAAVFDPDQATNHLYQLVIPLWQNQSAAAFRPLAKMLLGLSELFTYRRKVAPTADSKTGISRRTLITGLMTKEASSPEPRQEQITVERPLHPALQYGLTTALLQTVAAVTKISIAELIAKEYALSSPNTAVPLLVNLDDETIQTTRSILPSHVAAIGYTTGENNHKTMLGAQGERLQQHIRKIAAWLPQLDKSFQPSLLVNLKGSFGELFENNDGKVLGALYGLEQAAKPYPLLIENPVWLDNRDEQFEHLKQLKSYLKMRRMQLRLVADAWADSLADVDKFAQGEGVHGLHIELPRLGNLEAAISAILYCQAQSLDVILSGEASPLTTHVALATRPTLLSGPPTIHHNIMQQFLAAS